jgi:hypothetical protein
MANRGRGFPREPNPLNQSHHAVFGKTGVGWMSDRSWWDRWYVLAAIVLISAIPLLWPSTPPLVDVPGHIGRFRVELDLGSSEHLQRYFDFSWKLIGNLGFDLLIIPANAVVGLESGVKLLVLTIPVLTTLGLFLVARRVHGTIPPTAFFAVPFTFGFPFNYGFINFALSMALALLAYALWLSLSDRRAFQIRSFLFVPISCLLWLVHAFGWGVLGLLAWSSEMVRLRDEGRSWPQSGMRAALACLPLAIPLVLILVWRSGDVRGATIGYFDLAPKTLSLLSALRDRWLLWDSISVGAAIVLIGSAIFDKHLEFSRKLAIPAMVLTAVFIVMPGQVFGSAYADSRLAPYMLMMALLAIRPRADTRPEIHQRVAILAVAFAALRLGGNALSFGLADNEAKTHLAALQHIPEGARVLTLVGDTCAKSWPMPRHSHLASFVIARKQGFSNDQWQLPGAQLLLVTYAAARPFAIDPSEVTYSKECQERIEADARKHRKFDVLRQVKWRIRTADQALDLFPREAFDYVWLIQPEGYTARPRPGLRPIWATKDSVLFQIDH